ncbi:STM4015 family protein [Actinomadura vinacea]|uniref:STM4015 family protein n=1 Tax=Actinomadura vinacea TaxID=115336 RepID=A0ABN3IW32_9ACTN
MPVYEHLSTFAGKDVTDSSFEHEGESVPLAYEPGTMGELAWRVGTSYEGTPFADVFGAFLEQNDTAEVTHLVIGYWGASYDDNPDVDPVRLVVDAAARLPNLRALFLGDITMEESEISWIEGFDITPLFETFPGLEHIGVRGSGPVLNPFEAPALRTLRFESGGLSNGAVRAVGDSDLPVLESLELWLGVADYGGRTTVEDLAGILSGERLPSLHHLGLEDSEIQDDIAAAIASAPIVARLESLSLAMGALTDQGAEALLSGQPLTHLKRLDLHHHFLTDPMMERFRTALPGVEVELGDQRRPEDDRVYVAVAE